MAEDDGSRSLTASRRRQLPSLADIAAGAGSAVGHGLGATAGQLGSLAINAPLALWQGVGRAAAPVAEGFRQGMGLPSSKELAAIAALPNNPGGHGQISNGEALPPAVAGNGKAAQVPTFQDALMHAGLTNRDLPALQAALPVPRQMTFGDQLKNQYANMLADQLQTHLQAANGNKDLIAKSFEAHQRAFLPLITQQPLNVGMAAGMPVDYYGDLER